MDILMDINPLVAKLTAAVRRTEEAAYNHNHPRIDECEAAELQLESDIRTAILKLVETERAQAVRAYRNSKRGLHRHAMNGEGSTP